MNTFLLEVITPEKQFFKGEVEALSCTTHDGEIGILKGHQTMVSTVEVGELKIKQEGQWKNAFISEGFMEVRSDEVVIFTQSCLWPEEIDIERAERDRQRVLERIDHEHGISEHRRNEIALARALTRLKIKRKSAK